MSNLILGSTSPRRHHLLKEAGFAFVAARPDIDETPHPDEPAVDYVARLSREKASAVAAQQSGLILTADTTVAIDNHILGKPEDAADAHTMLSQLRGRTHHVHTGVALLDANTRQTTTLVVTTEVLMRDYTDAEIAAYIASGDPFGKAGSYAIQNRVFHPVKRVLGCYTNVVGLPICMVCRLLAERGLSAANTPSCAVDQQPCQYQGLF
ncbi:MAG: septum formation protein Maf [Anaerolineae bacterium]|nr:septum formation protein Maf [Anaerolineae bacterium]